MSEKNMETTGEQERKSRSPLHLFLTFFRFGWFTFGGGWSVVAQMDKQFVQGEKTISSEELLDLTSVGRSLPGTMIGNVAMMYGYRMAGPLGGFACVLGMISPPFLVLVAITAFYNAFISNPWVAAAMTGVRAAVVPIIISAMANMVKGAFKYPPCWVVAAVCCVLYLFFNASCVALVLLGGVCGLAMSEYYNRKEAKTKQGKEGE